MAVVANIGYWLYCLFDIHRQLKLDVVRYMLEVVKPAIFLSVFLLFVGFVLVYYIQEDSFYRFLIVLASMLLVGTGVIYGLLSEGEREFVSSIFRKLYSRVK